MSATITGTQPHQTNDRNPQVKDSGPTLQAGPHEQELIADRPPQSTVEPAEAGQAKAKSRRGFAAMDRTLVSAIARKGGKAAHTAGTAHEFTSEEAREAGRKGGRATHAKRRGVVLDGLGKPPEEPSRE
jgi:general stress protein YciG